MYFNYFFVALIRYPDKSNFKRKGHISWFTVQGIHCGREGMVTGREDGMATGREGEATTRESVWTH